VKSLISEVRHCLWSFRVECEDWYGMLEAKSLVLEFHLAAFSPQYNNSSVATDICSVSAGMRLWLVYLDQLYDGLPDTTDMTDHLAVLCFALFFIKNWVSFSRFYLTFFLLKLFFILSIAFRSHFWATFMLVFPSHNTYLISFKLNAL
jgi:hypothetical protein